MFPAFLKRTISSEVVKTVAYLREKHPDIQHRINVPPEIYSLHELFATKTLKNFITKNEQLILTRYKQFVEPEIQMSGRNLPQLIFEHFIEDFFQYACYKCAESQKEQSAFDELWQRFESDFFAEEIKIKYICRLKNLIAGGGGIGLNEIVRPLDIKMLYLHCPIEYKLLAWERKGTWRFEYLDNFDNPWVILEKEVVIRNGENVATHFSSARNQFELFTLVMRCVQGGSVYFNNIRIFGLGNYGLSASHMTRPLYENDLNEQLDTKTTLKYPEDWWISNVLKKVVNDNYEDNVFADWNIKLSKLQPKPIETAFSGVSLEFYLFGVLLNLTFAYNSLVFDNGNFKNAEFRKYYFPKLINKYFGWDTSALSEATEIIYEIRNKVAHGHYSEAREILYNRNSTAGMFLKRLNLFEKAVYNLIVLSLVNNDLKAELEAWYNSGQPNQFPQLVHPYQL